MIIEDGGHICLFLPKFHCELNPIEIYWAYIKQGEVFILIFLQNLKANIEKTFTQSSESTAENASDLKTQRNYLTGFVSHALYQQSGNISAKLTDSTQHMGK